MLPFHKSFSEYSSVGDYNESKDHVSAFPAFPGSNKMENNNFWNKFNKNLNLTEKKSLLKKQELSMDGISLLKEPSKQLNYLILSSEKWMKENKKVFSDFISNHPVVRFCVQKHNLENLTTGLKMAINKTGLKNFALQTYNRSLRLATQIGSLHDIIWHFISAVKIKSNFFENGIKNHKNIKESLIEFYLDVSDIYSHPVSDIYLLGKSSNQLIETFHYFLQSLADVIPYLPQSSNLLQLSLSCWCIKFEPYDHEFLYKCNIFKHLSKILSNLNKKGDYIGDIIGESKNVIESAMIFYFKDITEISDIRASSRQQMLASLYDCSTDTFWESGDDDKNKSKVLNITNKSDKYGKLTFSVYIDNLRDCNHRTNHISLSIGNNQEDMQIIRSQDIDLKFVGWINVWISSYSKYLKAEFKGPDNSLRLRQVKLLELNQAPNYKTQVSTQVIQKESCDIETLKVFKLLTYQILGQLVINSNEKNNSQPLDRIVDLEKQVVDILSQCQLTSMQKQVCSYILQSIRKESIRMQEEWEDSLVFQKKLMNKSEVKSDLYCYELLSLIVAVSGSNVGRNYLSRQYSFIEDLLTLLHVSSLRIQFHVLLLLRRILMEAKPKVFADIVGVSYSTSSIDLQNKKDFTIHKGILDTFLACVAKSLLVHIKKPKSVDSSNLPELMKLSDFFASQFIIFDRWYFRGTISKEVSELVISLLRDMSKCKMSNEWMAVTKNALSNPIFSLVSINENQVTTEECMKLPCMWLSLASLCILTEEDLDHFISKQQDKSSTDFEDESKLQIFPICENHDDGKTTSTIVCTLCGNLCKECDRILHLNKKMKTHHRQILKQELKENLRIDCHEGCGRLKLPWLLAFADPTNLKAVVEFRNRSQKDSNALKISSFSISDDLINSKELSLAAAKFLLSCRFCSAKCSETNNLYDFGSSIVGPVCDQLECKDFSKSVCRIILNCGHFCNGIKDEINCLPCLHGCPNEIFDSENNPESLDIENKDIEIELEKNEMMLVDKNSLSLNDKDNCSSLSAIKKNKKNDRIHIGLKQDADDMCIICFSDSLISAPCIQLSCCHVFHFHCCKQVLLSNWPGPRITFAFSLCPICKVPISHPALQDILISISERYEDVRRKALVRLEYEGLHLSEAILKPGSYFYGDPARFAMHRYAYYVCYKCDKAYYGGEVRCEERVSDRKRVGSGVKSVGYNAASSENNNNNKENSGMDSGEDNSTRDNNTIGGVGKGENKAMVVNNGGEGNGLEINNRRLGGLGVNNVGFGDDDYDPSELVCGACSDVACAQMCPKHGADFLEYKCRYCCSVAVFFCFGTTHFCNACHDDFQRIISLPKHMLPQCSAISDFRDYSENVALAVGCPLNVLHPPTGEEFALGCGICRNASTF